MAYIKAPNMSIWEYDSYGNLTGEYFTPPTKDNYQGDGFKYFNPVAVARLGKNDKVNNSLMNSFTLRYKLFPWLTLNETASIEIQGEKQNAYLPYNAVGSDWLDWFVNKADEVNQINQSIKTQTQLLYNIPFANKKHQLAGALTWNTDDGRYENMRVESNKTPSTDIQDPAINAQINYIGSYLSQTRQIQGIVSVNYKFDDRYLLQTILTRDAHTAFGVNNRWGTFYGISAAWRFSKEPLLMDYASILGESKIKVSYGSSGRKPNSSYDRFATYGSGSGIPSGYLDHLAVVPQQIQLSNLKWETQASWNIGLDLNLFEDRFNSTLEFYKKKTTDILFGGWQKEYKIPRSSGFEYLKWFNGGELENRGWEVMLDYKVIKKKDLIVSVNFNISQNQNSFTKLPANYNNEKSISIANGEYPQVISEGNPIGSFYGFRFLGVYSTDADAVAKDAEGNTIYDIMGDPVPMTYKGTYPFRGGDAKYEDVNHDGKIDLNDVVYIGNSNPKFYGGFGPSVRFKNFSASCQFQFRTGYDIINYIALQTQGMNDYNNQSTAVLRRWRTSGQNESNLLPRAYLNHPANNLGSDRYVEKGDFLRLLNVQFGYKVSSKVCEKIHLRSLSTTLSARKIGTWTNYSGQDPEISQDASDPFWMGVDKSRTPPARVITFAISVGF
jgi:TonB-linked SusC/RagA family outer membrane protein